MSETSDQLEQQILWDTSTSTSSQVSEPLPSECLEQDIPDPLEPLQGVFLALTSRMQENGQDLKANKADSGLRCIDSFKKRLLARWDSISLSWKTWQLSLGGDYQEYSETLPKQGMMLSGNVYELAILEHHIDENESSLWRTPCARDNHPSGTGYQPGRTIQLAHQVQTMWPTPAAQDSKNATLPPSQRERDTLPGARLRQAPGLWRTPQADENGSIKSPEERKGHNLSLSNQIQGSLNPSWVETLMGLPIGWTDIDGLPDQESNNIPGNHQELPQENKRTA